MSSLQEKYILDQMLIPVLQGVYLHILEETGYLDQFEDKEKEQILKGEFGPSNPLQINLSCFGYGNVRINQLTDFFKKDSMRTFQSPEFKLLMNPLLAKDGQDEIKNLLAEEINEFFEEFSNNSSPWLGLGIHRTLKLIAEDPHLKIQFNNLYGEKLAADIKNLHQKSPETQNITAGQNLAIKNEQKIALLVKYYQSQGYSEEHAQELAENNADYFTLQKIIEPNQETGFILQGQYDAEPITIPDDIVVEIKLMDLLSYQVAQPLPESTTIQTEQNKETTTPAQAAFQNDFETSDLESKEPASATGESEKSSLTSGEQSSKFQLKLHDDNVKPQPERKKETIDLISAQRNSIEQLPEITELNPEDQNQFTQIAKNTGKPYLKMSEPLPPFPPTESTVSDADKITAYLKNAHLGTNAIPLTEAMVDAKTDYQDQINIDALATLVTEENLLNSNPKLHRRVNRVSELDLKTHGNIYRNKHGQAIASNDQIENKTSLSQQNQPTTINSNNSTTNEDKDKIQNPSSHHPSLTTTQNQSKKGHRGGLIAMATGLSGVGFGLLTELL